MQIKEFTFAKLPINTFILSSDSDDERGRKLVVIIVVER